MRQLTRAILIAGPTASGKSGLALRLAETLGGVVINADSMQVYRDLRILTARPGPEEEARVPHALYGFVSGREAYSAARFAADAARAINEATDRGLRPIIVGGTGLYFRALIEGLSPMPEIPEKVRANWRAEASKAKPGALHALLAQRDPEMAARLAPGDTQRIARALEVIDYTGKSLATWQAKNHTYVSDEFKATAIKLVLDASRAWNCAVAGERFYKMMQNGALDEVQTLLSHKLSSDLPIMRAIGVREIGDYLSNRISIEEAVCIGQAKTRQLAKRQGTWYRTGMKDWRRYQCEQPGAVADVAEQIEAECRIPSNA